jgi:hypothetical protein
MSAEIKDIFINSLVYPNTEYVAEWLNISSSNSIYLVVYCDSSYTVSLDYAVDDQYEIILNESTNYTNESAEFYLPSKTRFLRISVIGLTPPVNLKVQAFFHPTSVQSNAMVTFPTDQVLSVKDSSMSFTGYGALHTEQIHAKRQYLFVRCVSGTIEPKTWALPYTDLVGFDSVSPVGNAQIIFDQNIVKLTGFNTIGERALLTGSGYTYRPGQALIARWSSSFFQGPKDPGGTGCTVQFVAIANLLPTNEPHNGYFFGYADDTLIYENDSFGVGYNNNTVTQFVPRTSWNRDRANGLDSTLNISSWENLNSFQIDAQYGGGNINFYVEDKTQGCFILVHIFELADTSGQSICTDPSFQFLMCQEVTANSIPLATTDYIGVAFFGLFIAGDIIDQPDRFGYDNSKIGVMAEENILTLQSYIPWYPFSANHSALDFDILSFATDGTKSAIIRVYRNCIITTPTYTPIYPDFIAVNVDDGTGTFGGLGTGILLYSVVLSKVDSLVLNLSDIHTHLDPGSHLTITCESTSNTDVSVSCGFHQN